MQGTEMNHDDQIRQLAYKLWQDEGCPDGYDVRHWLKAETMWLEEHRPKDKPKVSTSPKGRKRGHTRALDREL